MSMQETMKAVVQAHQIVERFHQTVADIFRFVLHEMEENEPAFNPLLARWGIFASTLDPSLHHSDRWKVKHFAHPLEPAEEEDLPYLLVHISLDPAYSDEPEVWLGTIHELEINAPGAVEEEAIEYIFQDYFGPEDDWTQPDRWYEESLEDETVSAKVSFLRFPLARLSGAKEVQQEICDRLRQRCQEPDES